MLIFTFSYLLLLRSNHAFISHTVCKKKSILSPNSKLQSIKSSISPNAQFLSCSAYSQQPTSHRFNFTFQSFTLCHAYLCQKDEGALSEKIQGSKYLLSPPPVIVKKNIVSLTSHCTTPSSRSVSRLGLCLQITKFSYAICSDTTKKCKFSLRF